MQGGRSSAGYFVQTSDASQVSQGSSTSNARNCDISYADSAGATFPVHRELRLIDSSRRESQTCLMPKERDQSSMRPGGANGHAYVWTPDLDENGEDEPRREAVLAREVLGESSGMSTPKFWASAASRGASLAAPSHDPLSVGADRFPPWKPAQMSRGREGL